MPRLDVWSAPTAAPGARRVGALPTLLEVERTRTRSTEDELAVRVPRADVAGIPIRAVLVLTEEDGAVTEWRVTNVRAELGSQLAEVRAVSLLEDLADVDLVVVADPVTGDPRVSFDAEGTPRDVLLEYAFTPASLGGVGYLELGVVEATAVRVYQFSETTPLGVLRAVADAFGHRIRVTRQGDGVHVVDVVASLEPDAPAIRAELGGVLADLVDERNADGLATVVRVTDGAGGGRGLYPLSEAAFRLDAATDAGGGESWLELSDPQSDASPILEPGQFVGKFVSIDDGRAVREILASRVSPTPAVRTAEVVLAGSVAVNQFKDSGDLSAGTWSKFAMQPVTSQGTATDKGVTFTMWRIGSSGSAIFSQQWTPGSLGSGSAQRYVTFYMRNPIGMNTTPQRVRVRDQSAATDLASAGFASNLSSINPIVGTGHSITEVSPGLFRVVLDCGSVNLGNSIRFDFWPQGQSVSSFSSRVDMGGFMFTDDETAPFAETDSTGEVATDAAIGSVVRFVEDASESPLLELSAPSAVSRVGRVVGVLRGDGVPSDRNRLNNPAFTVARSPILGGGADAWTARGSASARVATWPREEMGKVIDGIVDGGAASGQNVVPLRGLPPGFVSLNWERVDIPAQSLIAGARFLIDENGRATFSLSPAAPAAFSDNAVVSWGAGRTANVDGAVALGATSATIDGLPAAPTVQAGDVLEYTTRVTSGGGIDPLGAFATVPAESSGDDYTFDLIEPLSVGIPIGAAVETSVLTAEGRAAATLVLRATATAGATTITVAVRAPSAVTGLWGSGFTYSDDVTQQLTVDVGASPALVGERVHYVDVELTAAVGAPLRTDAASPTLRWLRAGSPVQFDGSDVLLELTDGALGDRIRPTDDIITLAVRQAAPSLPAGTSFSLGGASYVTNDQAQPADANGETSIALGSNLATSLADGQVVRWRRPVIPEDPDVPGPNLLLTLSLLSSTFSTANGQRSERFRVVVPPAGTVTVAVIAWAYLWSYSSASVRAGVSLHNATTNALLASATVSPYPVTNVGPDTALPVVLSFTHDLTATTECYVQLQGAEDENDPQRVLWRGAAAYTRGDTDAPFVDGSLANPVWAAAQRALADSLAEGRTVDASLLDTYAREALAALDPTELRPGRLVTFPAIGVSATIERIVQRLVTGELASVGLATRPRLASSSLASLL